MPTVPFDLVKGSASNGGDVNLDISGVQDGDIVLVFIAQSGDISDPSLITPENTGFSSNWVKVTDGQIGDQGFSIVGASSLYKTIWNTGDNTTIVANGSGVTTSATAAIAAVIRSASIGIPIEVSSFSYDFGVAAHTPDCGAVTPINDDCLIVIFAASTATDSDIGNSPTNYSPTTAAFVLGDDDNDIGVAAAYRSLSGGGGSSENPGTWSAWSNGFVSTVTVAIRSESVASVGACVTDGGANTNGGNVNLDISGVRQDDILYVQGAGGVSGREVPGPSGTGFTNSWQQVASYVSSSGGAIVTKVWRILWESGDDLTVVGQGTGNAADATVYNVIGVRGADPTTPEDVSITTASSTVNTTPDPPAITPAHNNCLILAIAASRINDSSVGNSPSGYSNVVTLSTGGNATDTNPVTAHMVFKSLDDGASVEENPGTWAAWGNAPWGAFTIAVRAFEEPLNIIPGNKNLTISTSAPIVTAPLDTVITPDKVDLSFTKFSPILETSYTITPNNKNLIFSTFVPNILEQEFFTPISTDLNFSTSTPNVLQDVNIRPDKQDLNFSAFAPDLNPGSFAIGPDKKDLNFSTFAPDFSLDFVFIPISKNLSFDIFSPNSQQDTRIEPGKDDLIFSSSSVDISYIYKLEPQKSDLLFSKFVPNLFFGTGIRPDFKELNFSSFPPDFDYGFRFPETGSLNFNSFSPIVSYGFVIVPDVGNLVFTLNIPTKDSISPVSKNLIFTTFAPNLFRLFSLKPITKNLIFSEFSPNVRLFINRSRISLSPYVKSPIAAIEVDLFSDDEEEIVFRFWSGENTSGLTRLISEGDVVQFDPRLLLPIEIGFGIEAQQYGEVVKGIPKSGNIEFMLDESVWSYLNYHWLGRNLRIYEGESGDKFEDLFLSFTGKIDDLTFDSNESRAKIKIADNVLDLDKPLVEELYPDDALEALKGRPKPYLRGTVYSIEPVLEDETTQTYRISWNKPLDEIMEVRVGGIVWDKVDENPGDGEWAANLEEGTFTLGSETLGNEVRCDAKAGIYSTVDLIREIIEESGGSVDEEICVTCSKIVTGPIGYYKGLDPVNKVDVLDEIVFSAGASWEFGLNGKIKIRILESPNSSLTYRHSPLLLLNEINVDAVRLIEIIPPAWRIKTEYKRNWQPLTNPLSGVEDVDKEFMQSDGIVSEVLEDENIKILEPRAVDVPLIRTLFVNQVDAISVRDRLFNAWNIERRIYDIDCWLDFPPEIYDTVEIRFQMISGYFRIHSVLRKIGGGLTTLRVWGNKNIISGTLREFPLPPKIIESNPARLKITTYIPEVEWALYAHWPIDEGSGSIVNDISGFNRDGTLSSTGMWVADDGDGFILNLDGENINFGGIANFERTQPFSVSIFIKTTYSGFFSSNILNHGDVFPITDLIVDGWQLSQPYAHTEFIRIQLSDNDNKNMWKVSTIAVNDGEKHHVAFTYDGGNNLNLYIDGVESSDSFGNSSLTGSMLSSENLISGVPVGRDVKIKNIKIWRKELSEDEILREKENG